MNKKLLIKIGSIAAISLPIASVISCGKNVEPSKEELEIYKTLTSESTMKSLENEWQYQAIDNQLNPGSLKWTKNIKMNVFQKSLIQNASKKFDINQKYVKTAIWYIKEKLQNDSNFIKKIGEALGGYGKTSKDKNGKPEIVNNKFSSEWLAENGLLNEYPYGKIDYVGTPVNSNKLGISDEGLEFLILEPTSGFSDEINKFFIAQNYLESVTKSQWKATFPAAFNQLDSTRANDIKEDQFLIVKKAIDGKYFSKWHIELDEIKSLGFRNLKNVLYDKALEIVAGRKNTLGASLKYSEKNTLYNGGFNHLLNVKNNNYIKANSSTTNVKYNELLNYQGISTMNSKGSKNLTFSDGSLKKDFTKRDNWEGFIVPSKDELINGVKASDIDLRTKHESGSTNPIKISFDYVKGFMPIYDSNKFQFKDNDFKNEVAKLIAFKNPDIYKEAMNYYTTKITGSNKRDAIIVKIMNKDYRDIYEEKGVRFIKEFNPEDNPQN